MGEIERQIIIESDDGNLYLVVERMGLKHVFCPVKIEKPEADKLRELIAIATRALP